MDTYLILGASSDIGTRFLSELNNKKERCIVYAQYNTSCDRLKSLSLESDTIQLEYRKCDLSDSLEVKEWIQELNQKGVVPSHVLHFAADKFRHMRIKKFEWELVQKDIEIQVRSFAEIMSNFLPKMVGNRFGRVVVMLSSYTLGKPPKYMSNYVLVKYALLGLVKAMAVEYEGRGVTINAISPNMMETKFLDSLDKRMIEMNANDSSMKRNVDLDEVCEGIFYLLSSKSSYTNGINLNISGGDYF